MRFIAIAVLMLVLAAPTCSGSNLGIGAAIWTDRLMPMASVKGEGFEIEVVRADKLITLIDGRLFVGEDFGVYGGLNLVHSVTPYVGVWEITYGSWFKIHSAVGDIRIIGGLTRSREQVFPDYDIRFTKSFANWKIASGVRDNAGKRVIPYLIVGREW